jgi:hypothetical protein
MSIERVLKFLNNFYKIFFLHKVNLNEFYVSIYIYMKLSQNFIYISQMTPEIWHSSMIITPGDLSGS